MKSTSMFTADYLRLVKALAARVSAETGITVEAILGRGRTKKVSAARHQLMLLLWREEKLTLLEVGAVLDRDHSSVIYGLKKTMGAEVYKHEVAARYPRRVAA